MGVYFRVAGTLHLPFCLQQPPISHPSVTSMLLYYLSFKRYSCVYCICTEPTKLWQDLKGIEVSERKKLVGLGVDLSRKLGGLVAAVRQGIRNADFTPKDYHPPQYPAPYNYSEEPEQHAKLSSVCQFSLCFCSVFSRLTSFCSLSLLGVYAESRKYTQYQYEYHQGMFLL